MTTIENLPSGRGSLEHDARVQADIEAYERIKRDREHVRAIRDSKRICKRCTFCGRCKRGVRKKRPAPEAGE